MKLLKNEWESHEIGKNEAKVFVEKWHYAHGAGEVITKCFGLFYKGDPGTLHGVSIWNPPPPGAAKSVSNNYHDVLALSRFCLISGRPENAGSYLISNSIKKLDKYRWPILLTYADTALNHNGGLYRASNWDYDGMTGKNPIYWDPDKQRMVSRKKGPKTYGKKAMLEMGYEFKGKFAKHRFIYPMNRRDRHSKPIGQQMDLLFTENGKIWERKNGK